MRHCRKKIYVIKTKNDEILFSSIRKLDEYVAKHKYLEREENEVYVEYFQPKIKVKLTFENLK